MVDVQSRKIGLWADTGDRADPETLGLDRGLGWTVGYEQQGSGLLPERLVFNQLLRELSGWAMDRMTQGIPTWDAGIDYTQHAFVTHLGMVYVSDEATGPATGNPVAPNAAGQTTWRLY